MADITIETDRGVCVWRLCICDERITERTLEVLQDMFDYTDALPGDYGQTRGLPDDAYNALTEAFGDSLEVVE